ncbi:hypothetical protein AB2M62_16290 [Sphingomonas sp. MMS12-HWE2-04]|uniref:hypothetical protein n=1 Tax=Sphingomonas sp. MMS12-HWE2-04 TaxID=3234199 RepID=UPI00384F7631
MIEETSEPARDSARYGQPVVATLAGGAALVLAAIAGPWIVPEQPLGVLLAGGALIGAVLWLIGYLSTTRHSALPWVAGSLAVLLAAGAGAGFVMHGQYESWARADASSFAELELGPEGSPKLPQGIAGRGPISKLYAQTVQADGGDARELGAAMGKAGLGNLNSPYLLQQDPRLIENCGVIAGLKQLAADQAKRRGERHAALAKAIDTASLPASARQGIALVAQGPDGAALLANQQAMLDASTALCTMLAGKRWTNNMGYFGFGSGSDAAVFAQVQVRQRMLADGLGAINGAAAERFTSGREMVRDALSRSVYTSG